MNGREKVQLVRLDEKVKLIHEDVKEIKETINDIKKNFSLRRDVCMSRFERIENKIYMAVGGLSVLSILALTKAVGLW